MAEKQYIEREAVIALAKDIVVPTKFGYDYRHRCVDPQEIAELPAADVRPVVRGKWKYKEGGELCADGYYCTACGTGFHVHVPYFAEFNFCPNCGANMREPPKEG